MRILAAIIAVGISVLARADALSTARDLGLSRVSLQELAPVQAREGGGVMLSVELDGRPVVLDLAPKSYRSEAFRLVLDMGGGETIEVEPPAPKTVRGTVAGDPTSVVAGSIIDGEARLMILTDEGTWSVQPAEGEGAGVHAVYNQRDILRHDGVCAEPVAGAGALGGLEFPGRPTFALRGTEGEFRVAEIAIDADWQLFSTYFSQNQTTLLNDIDSVMAGVSAIYERDVLLTYTLTHVLIRTSSAANPYTTNDPSALLSQFQQEWNNNQQSVPRDVAHLWTGRNMTGSTIGIAYLGTICTSSAYGADQIRFTTNYNSRVGLFSHELGHNWNAPHCDGASECRIMCSGLGGCDGLGTPVRFAPTSIATINSFIANRTCVDQVGVDLPIFENFEDQVLEAPTWSGSVGFSIITDGDAPSGSRVGQFTPPFSTASTAQVDTTVAPGSTVAVSLFLEPQSTTAGDFRVDIRTESGSNLRAALIPAHSPSAGYVEYSFQLPGSALNRTTPFSFTPSSTGPVWRADDIDIRAVSSTSATVSLPLVEDFERAALFLDRWQPCLGDVSNATAATGTYSLGLDAGQRLFNADALAAGLSDIVFGALVQSPSAPSGDAELVIEYRNSSGAWIEVDRVPAGSVPSDEFALVEVILPAGAAHNDLSVAIEIDGAASNEPWWIDDLELGGKPRGTADCPADLAAPFGVLDLGDIGAFVTGFTAQDPIADLAAPFGVFDLADVGAFTASFVAGCP